MAEVRYICDKCESANVEVKRVIYNERKEKRMIPSLDWEYWETVSYEIKYDCTCKDCGHTFTEYPYGLTQ